MDEKLEGMLSKEELLNLLTSLDETGGCHRQTLRIVAKALGIRAHFDREVGQLDAHPGGVVVERPVYFLESSQ